MEMYGKLAKNIDIYLGLLSVIAGIAILVVGMKITNYRLEQVSLVLIIAGIVYLLLRKKLLGLKSYSFEGIRPKLCILVLNLFFFLIFTISILILNQNFYSRPLLFLILISIMAGIIAVEVFSASNNIHYCIILFKIFIIGILLRGSVFYQYPSMIGGDPWSHAAWIKQIIESGYVSDLMGGYKFFPTMHIFTASISDITGMVIKDSMFIVSICELLSLIFIFLFVRQILDVRIGLLSVLLVTVSNWHTQMGFLIIPQTFCIIFLPMLIYLVVSNGLKANVKYYSLIILTLIISIFSHTLTCFAILIVIISIWFAVKIVESLKMEKIHGNFSFLPTLIIFFAIALIAYWIFQTYFFGYIVESVSSSFSQSYQQPPESTINEDYLTMAISWLPTYISIFFGIIGSLIIINKRHTLSLTLYGWGVVIFVFTSTFLNLSAFLPGRWFVFIDIALVIPIAIALTSMSYISNRKNIILFLVIVVFSLIMITNFEANVTSINPLTPNPTQALKSSEMIAAQTITDKAPQKINLYSDVYYLLYVNATDGSDILSGNKEFHGILLVRKEIEDNVFLSTYKSTGHYNVNKPLTNINADNFLKVYDCKTVMAFER